VPLLSAYRYSDTEQFLRARSSTANADRHAHLRRRRPGRSPHL